MELNELVGITLNINFEYKTETQRNELKSFLWEKGELSKVFKDIIDILCEDFFRNEIENLSISEGFYIIKIDSYIVHDSEIDESLDWIVSDIDITTTPEFFDKIFDYMNSFVYEDKLIDQLKKSTISYLLKSNLEEPMNISVEITEIGGN